MSSRRGRKKGALTFVDRDKAMQMAEFEKLKVSKFGDQIAKGMKDKQLVQKAAQVHTHSCTRYNIKISLDDYCTNTVRNWKSMPTPKYFIHSMLQIVGVKTLE